MERRGLGRGLSALLAEVNVDANRPEGAARPVTMVPVDQLRPNPDQPRRTFSEEPLRQLAESIRQKGVVQPLIVRAVEGQAGYEIVAGERRWRAAQLAGLHELPILQREFSDQEVLEIAIIENIQREDLNPIDEAMAYRQLIERFGHTQEKLAEALSRSRSHVANTLRLLTLPDPIQTLVQNGDLSAGHARALVTAPNAQSLAARIVAQGLSVRETEKLVKKSLEPPKAPKARTEKDADTRAIEADLSANLGLPVRIDFRGSELGGSVTINFQSLDDLDFLCDALSRVSRGQM